MSFQERAGRFLIVLFLATSLGLGTSPTCQAQSSGKEDASAKLKAKKAKSAKAQATESSSPPSATGETATNADNKAPAFAPESESPASAKSETPKLAKATFAGGCFWSMEAVFDRLPGVKSAVSGFSGGKVPFPSYEYVCTGQTGHAEVIQVTYDPSAVTYEHLLEVFFTIHDPTTRNRQGDDYGTQYRSVIFYQDDEQKQAATKYIKDLTANKVFRRPIVTDVVAFKKFYPAEKYHQNYFTENPYSDYSGYYIVPKLEKLTSEFNLSR